MERNVLDATVIKLANATNDIFQGIFFVENCKPSSLIQY